MALPPLVLDPRSFIPPYEQIRAQISALINAGALGAGAPLPAVRQLARDLGVAPNTVMRAYTQLREEGQVTISSRQGVMVAGRLPTPAEGERVAALDIAVDHLLAAVTHLSADARDIHAAIDRRLGRTHGGDAPDGTQAIERGI